MLKKHRFPILLLVSILCTGSLLAFTPKIFYVNLYDKAVDVRLGTTNNYVFIMNGLGPNKATYMVNASSTGSYGLYFKVSTKDEWTLWTDENDKAYSCDVENNKDNCIVTGTDGHVEFFTLEEADNDAGAKVCFFNGTESKLPRMEVGSVWGTPKAYIDDLSPNAVSTFVTITPGDYSIFWQFPEQKKKDKYYFNTGSDNKTAEKYTFENGDYFLFLTYSDGRTDYGTLYTITPPSSKVDKNKGKGKKKGGTKLED
jgi:hypothetical protein